MGKAAVDQSASDDPRALFDINSKVEPTFLSDKLVPFSGALIGATLMFAYNYSRRRPLLATFPLTVASTLGGLAICTYWEHKSQLYYAERDAIYRHYIELHPEDFKPKERVVVGDMFKPWLPIR